MQILALKLGESISNAYHVHGCPVRNAACRLQFNRWYSKAYSHVTSGKRVDRAIFAPADALTVYDSSNRLYRTNFILDVKTVSVVNAEGVLTPAFNADKGKITGSGLLQQEEFQEP